ncbi:DUF4160 domain-containing protein [Afifella marina]|nr:DUF4160 domain-containing protein [Afifella marina]
MPTVQSFAACKLVIYADDHLPPHFHLKSHGWSCVVDIRSLQITRGSSPVGGTKEALEWAGKNKALLMQKWGEYNERD